VTLLCSLAWVALLVPTCDPEPEILDPWAEHALLVEIGQRTVPARPDEPARDDAPADAYNPPEPEPPAPPPIGEVPEPWRSLAECESGDWIDGGRAFVEGSARWSWAKPDTDVPPWGTTLHHGGLQFHPDTWAWISPDVLDEPPQFAYDATPHEQVAVAEEVQRRQGWGAWPVCSRLVGLR
jgi:hypothetical protein